MKLWSSLTRRCRQGKILGSCKPKKCKDKDLSNNECVSQNTIPKNVNVDEMIIVGDKLVKVNADEMIPKIVNVNEMIIIGDKLVKENKLKQAEETYHEALKMTNYIQNDDTLSISADIFVKISNIQQGQGKMTNAFDSLSKAMVMYKLSIHKFEQAGNEKEWKQLGSKLVQVMILMADIFVDYGELENASEMYTDAIQTSREYLEFDDPFLIITLNSYGNFVSICRNDQDTALLILKLAMKTRVESLSDKSELDVYVADTLCDIGKVYMRMAINNNNEDDEVKQAEACFIKALQIYRLLGDESGKCAGALYNLEDARDWHREWKKIQPVKQCTSTLSSSFLLDETFDLIEVSYCLMPW